MRLKKSKQPKKYIAGGLVLAGVGGAAQAGLGAYQMIQGMNAAKNIKEASTARPSEYADMLKQARGADLEQKRLEELNRSISTGISAAQGAGGRALVGALPKMIQAADAGTIDIASKRQADTMQALQFGAQGAENEIGRNLSREMMERQAAQAAIEGGLQNISGGLGQIGTAGLYGAQLSSKGTDAIKNVTTPQELKKSTIGGSFGSSEAGMTADEFKKPIAENGGMITGGKFDHKTNPIDIVKSGRKVGEMTGGEVILNPAQQKKLSKESAYFRQLLKKFNKQK